MIKTKLKIVIQDFRELTRTRFGIIIIINNFIMNEAGHDMENFAY